MKPQLNNKRSSFTETISSKQSAILYIRVSTDEQATKGYSLRTQEERLVKYCASNEIEIIDIISEDYSAKTFKRPSWSKLVTDLKHSKKRPDLIIFTRWDRFSRNAADAYYMITYLRKLGIEVKGIDQPLDLSIPENKIMLALYIAASEVENDRRSLNVRNGMRKAKQEGRWMGGAPLGYIMRATGTGRKQLVIHDPEATLVRSIFNRVAENSSSLKLLYRQFVQAGLKCCYSNLCLLLHNPVYCGKIIIAEPENGTTYEVKGQHEALISEQLFNQVQAILNKKGRNVLRSKSTNKALPFRGFLYCPNCQKKLTGSGSKGTYKRYYYYHCSCGYRIRADRIEELFISEIRKLIPFDYYLSTYRNFLLGKYKTLYANQSNLSTQIDKLVERIIKAKDLLSTGEIDAEDFFLIKHDCENKIHSLGNEMRDSSLIAADRESHLNRMLEQLSHLDMCYLNADIDNKRKLISILLRKDCILNLVNFNENFSAAVQTIYHLSKEQTFTIPFMEKFAEISMDTTFSHTTKD